MTSFLCQFPNNCYIFSRIFPKPIPMARYSKETTAALKRVLMCRRDKGYRFNEGDMPELMEKTGLSRAEIVRWALEVKKYYDSPEAMEKYFEQNGAVSETNTCLHLFDALNTCGKTHPSLRTPGYAWKMMS